MVFRNKVTTGSSVADFNVAPTTGYRWILYGMFAVLHTSSTGGTRQFQIGYGPNTGSDALVGVLLDTGSQTTPSSAFGAWGSMLPNAMAGNGKTIPAGGVVKTLWNFNPELGQNSGQLFIHPILIAGDTYDYTYIYDLVRE